MAALFLWAAILLPFSVQSASVALQTGGVDLNGTLNLKGHRIRNIGAPLSDSDVSNKAYVDAAVAPVETAAQAQLSLDCPAGASGVYRVFVTPTVYAGDFGPGAAAGDAICQGWADSVSLGGTWGAYLCDVMARPWTRWPGDWLRDWCRLTDVTGRTLAVKQRTDGQTHGGPEPPFGGVWLGGGWVGWWRSSPTLDHTGTPIATDTGYSFWHGCPFDAGEPSFLAAPPTSNTIIGDPPEVNCCAINGPGNLCWGDPSASGRCGETNHANTNKWHGMDVVGPWGCSELRSLICFETVAST